MPFFGSLGILITRLLVVAAVVSAVLSEISTLAGAGISGYFDGNPTVQFYGPWGMAFDSAGNLYVAEVYNNVIRKISNTGVVTTFAGNYWSSGFLNGIGTNARFANPIGLAIDSVGNLYVGDSSNYRIRKITPVGVVTSLAGSGVSARGDGTQEGARFWRPNGAATDSSGNVYVFDGTVAVVRKITPDGVVTTLAGNNTLAGFADGTGTNARFSGGDSGLAFDSVGNLYVGDSYNNRIRKITPEGVVTTFAGNGTASSINGTGTNATFNRPQGVAFDSSGNIYVAEFDGHRIRKITPAGVVTTFAGSGQGGLFGAFADGIGTDASFGNPAGLVVDLSGNVYVADFTNNRIRKITPAGVVTTLAGSTSGYTDTAKNGATSGALLNLPRAVAVDSSSTMYVADTTNHRIRKITSLGVVTTLAGSGTATFADGIGTGASFNSPQGIAVDSMGNVYVGDTLNNRIRKITSTGVVTTLAGTGTATFADGTGTGASFNNPYGVTVDSAGNVYVIDKLNYRVRKITPDIVSSLASGLSSPYGVALDSYDNVFVAEKGGHRIRKITPAGVVTTLAGSGTTGSTDGTGTNASFNTPNGLTIDQAGNLYVADSKNYRIRKITPAGVVTTFAGNQNGVVDGIGTNAEFGEVIGITISSDGTLYISDSTRNNIRKIILSWVVSTFAGSGTFGYLDGTGTNARFGTPSRIAVGSDGTVYVADLNNGRIRRITPEGVVTTFAGGGTGIQDGTGTNAQFWGPNGLTIDSSGNLYVADTSSHRIRKITTLGVVTTLAGSGTGYGTGTGAFADGTGTNASFDNPYGVAVDSAGNVYVADTRNYRIRKITSSGVVTSLAGNGVSSLIDGTGTNARFIGPQGLVVDSGGNLFVADNNIIRKVTPAGVVTTIAGNEYLSYVDGTGTNAGFNSTQDISIHSSGTMYIAENRSIRRVTPAGVVTTIAGDGTSGYIDGTGTNARFESTSGIAVDSSGNLYVADGSNNRIRKIVLEGNTVTTFAGSWENPSGWKDGTGTNAWFRYLSGLTVDSTGNLFVADRGNNSIRKITSAGVVTTFAGSRSEGFLDGTGEAASFLLPDCIVFDSVGNLYVNDSYNHRIRIITPTGTVSTFAGTGTTTFADGTVLTATFNGGGGSGGLAFDSSGNLYVGDTVNGRVRKITRGAIVTTLAGNGTAQYLEGNGTAARFLDPFGIVVNSAGTLMYVTDSNYIRRITSAGVTTFIAGQAMAGSTNGTGVGASFSGPREIALLAAGTNVYVADTGNHIIRRVTTGSGVTTRYSGFGGAGFRETPVANVQYNNPSGIAVNSAGVVYVADTNNNRIRTIAAGGSDNTGVVTTVVGTSTAGYTDGGGWFNSPFGVATDSDGFVYVGDTLNNRIRKISPQGVVTSLAGNGAGTFADGTGTSASFSGPRGVALGSDGTVYVADTTNNRIRRSTPAGVVTIVAGNTSAGSTDGTSTSALFNAPNAITVNSSDIMYVADTGNHRIRAITQARVVTTFAGTTQGFQDGIGTNARFDTPRGIAADIYGNLYVADTNNHRIRRITSNGGVATLAGSTAGFADGTGTNAQFNFPTHLSIDGFGTLYVADQNNNRIRTIQTSTGVVSTLAGDGTAGFTPSRFNSPFGITVERFRNAYIADTNNHSIRKIAIVYNTLPDNNGVVTTLAGSGTATFADGTGGGASFNSPNGVAINSGGVVYVADQLNHRIRKITPAGVVTTFAGSGTATFGDGVGGGASFSSPLGIGFDSTGNLYIGDGNNNRIRKITPLGVVTTLAGSGSVGSSDGTGASASFYIPRQVAVDFAGNVYVADHGNSRVRKITSAGVVTTFTYGNYISGVEVDSEGNVYVADTVSNRIRKITSAGTDTIIAGSGTYGYLDGTGTNAQFARPYGLARDSTGNLYVVDAENNRVRKITPAGVVTTLAGSGTATFADGTGTNARFRTPQGIGVDLAGIVYVGDTLNNRIRKIGTMAVQFPLNGAVTTTFAGNGGTTFTNGTGTNATFNGPYGVAINSAGIMYVADTFNNRIRAITSAGVVTTLAGSGSGAFADGTGTGASFNNPTGVALDSGGTLYIADAGNHRIRKITSAGVVTTLAGGGSPATGYVDGTGTSARFNGPYGVAVDSAGTVYVGDATNRRIRAITAAGVVTTLAGSGAQGSTDGTGTNATFNFPWGIAVDSTGNLYISDQQNNNIRKITAAGVVTTLAGSGTATFADGTGTNASFRFPTVITIDSTNTLYLSDSGNNRIRRITPAGVVTTVAGSGIGQFADGTGTNASIWNPIGIAVDSNGIFYVGDTGNQRIRKVE